MTCIKTGAQVYYENYGSAVAADVYVVGDCYVVRFNPASEQFRAAQETDWRISIWFDAAVWHRNDLGVTVVPREYLIIPGE